MCTSMHASFSSTLVTVWAFKRNCFLIKVSMSTPLRSFRVSLVGNYEGKPMRSALQTPVNPQPEAFKGPEVPLHFSDRNPKKLPVSRVVEGTITSLISESETKVPVMFSEPPEAKNQSVAL